MIPQNQPQLAVRSLGTHKHRLLCLAGIAWLLSGAGQVFGQGEATSFSGEAILFSATDIHQPVTGPILIGDTGPLPAVGGVRIVTIPFTNVFGGLLTLRNGSASTIGGGIMANSTAMLQDFFIEFVDVNNQLNTLTASAIFSTASATCTDSGPVVSASSMILGLTINGQPITVSGALNQTITFPSFTVILNEETNSVVGLTGTISLNAIHILVTGCMNAVLGSVHADITCPTPVCPVCVAATLGLGAASGCTVLELGSGKVSMTGPAGGIQGDVCIGPGGSLDMSGDQFVTGTIKLGPGAHFSNSSHGTVNVLNNVDLSAQINAALAAAANSAALPCTQNFATLDGRTVTSITGNVGLNVICVGDISLAGKQITITGPVGAEFVFNVSGKFVLTGGGQGPQIRVAGGVQPKDVVYNILGSGEDVAFSGGGGGQNCCAAIVDGTLLAPQRKIRLSPGLVNGEVISSQDISIVSGASVRCPPCP